MLQPDLLDIFVLPLEKSGFEYMVTGSVASTIYGEPRLTHFSPCGIPLQRDVSGQREDHFRCLFQGRYG